MFNLPNIEEIKAKAEKVLADIANVEHRVRKLERGGAALNAGLENGLSGPALAQFIRDKTSE